jgi:hypothetical protein
VDAFTDQDMTREGQASVLAYARGRLDAQRELTGQIAGEFPAGQKNAGETA